MEDPQSRADLRLLTVEEVTRRTALSRSTIYGLMERGALRYVKLGRSRRIPLDALQELVARNTVSREP